MILFIFACGGVTETSQHTFPSEHPYEADFEEGQTIALNDLGIGLTEVVSTILSYNASTPIDAYANSMTQAESHCPSFYEYDGNSYWFASCETGSGTAFDGYSFFNTHEQSDYFQNGTLFDIDVLNGAATILDDIGLSHWGGSASLGEGQTEDGGAAFVSILNGTFYIEGVEQPWLTTGRSLNLVQYHILHPLPNGQSFQQIYLNGSIPVDEPGLTAVEFVEILAFRGHPHIACDLEPSGGVRLRTTEGLWVDVVFDVAQDWQMTGPCDGCGNAYLGDSPIGQLCFDIAEIFDWGESPW